MNNKFKNCRYGVMLYNTVDQYVGKSFEEYGEFSEGEAKIFREILQPGMTVLDVGANIGAHTVPMSKEVGDSGMVIAFEPQRIVFQNLCANVSLNSLTNVRTIHAAVGRSDSQVFIPDIDYSKEGNFGGIELGEYESGEVVKVIPIDSLQLNRCDFIKADVEGFEIEVLLGAKKTIKTYKPVLYIENDRKEKAEELLGLIRSLGYTIYQHNTYLFNPDNYYKNDTNIFGRIVSINVLCVHNSIVQNIDLPQV